MPQNEAKPYETVIATSDLAKIMAERDELLDALKTLLLEHTMANRPKAIEIAERAIAKAEGAA